MGDIIQTFSVRTGNRGKGQDLRLYFDTGSPHTFIKESAAKGLGHLMRLAPPHPFGGLGNGRFYAAAVADLFICFLGTWCSHLTYVVPDDTFGAGYDMLVGHDLMQSLNIKPIPRKHCVELDPVSIRLSLQVR